ncbi:MAG: PP2C family protein-serine/threonine phosphatase [Treponema sp.]
MYKTKKRAFSVIVYAASAVLYILFTLFLLMQSKNKSSLTINLGLPAVMFIAFLVMSVSLGKFIDRHLYLKSIVKSDTKYLVDFIDRLRFCYSFDDLFQAISDVLELKADCSVLFIEREKTYVLYNSPNRISSYYTTRDKVIRNFPLSWKDGFYYIGDSYDVVSSHNNARGFLLNYEHYQFYVFNRYTKLFDVEIYPKLFEEYSRFLSRCKTIENLAEISSLTKEWEQLAETQVSFLPRKMPDIQRLKLAAYYRPLVNVSGDYYSVLPIDSSKTLLMLGDVSGKGLPAALIMGLVMNTVKIIEDKEDLIAMVRRVDKAIKDMHLQDKYTVLFLGIVDTERMRMTYVNASMSDPRILSRAPDGYRIKDLPSTASLVGIIDIDDVRVAEMRLFRGDMILLATDGVSEVMDDNGVELGDTEIFKETLQTSAAKSPQLFIDDIVNLIMKYNGDKRLHDDVTMLVAKVG